MARASIVRLLRPAAQPLDRISPSLAEDLRACGLRAGFRRDVRFDTFRKLRPAAALGLISHEMAEAVARGEFDTIPASDLEEALGAEWDRRIADKAAVLASEWTVAPLPSPERWPGYQLTRVRIVRLLAEESRRRRRTGRGRQPEPEMWLEAPDVAVVGRVDRVERRDGDIELVDLKSGWTVDAEMKPAHRRQLLIYAYLWRATRGEWPQRVSVQRLDGLRSTLDVDPGMADEVVRETLDEVTQYNHRISSGEDPEALATPSSDACAHCDYRPVCAPFFEALEEGWGWYRRSLLGWVVSRTELSGLGAVEVRLEASNLGRDIEVARVLGIPVPQAPSLGSRVAIVDALPTHVPGDARVSWDTQVFVAPALP